MKTRNVFKFVIIVVFVLVLGANSTWAQAQPTQTQPIPVNSWVVGADVAPASWVKSDGVLQPFGMTASMVGNHHPMVGEEKDAWATVFVGYKPLGWFGGEVRFQKFGAHSRRDGPVDQTEGTPIVWGVDPMPHIVSTAPILNGPVGYDMKSSAKFSRIDILGNYSKEFQRGWVLAFAGVPILKVEGTENVARTQSFLLYARLPNSQLDTKGNREDYTFTSTSTATATMFGVAGGVEGEYCIVSSLVAEGRIDLATFPWGSTKLGGQFLANKNVYLVNVAGGVNATPVSTLAHLNLAPGVPLYSEAVRQGVTAIDIRIGLKWRVKVGERASLHLGMAISRSTLNSVAVTPGYLIKDPLAVGSGKFGSRVADMSVWAPTLTVGMWF